VLDAKSVPGWVEPLKVRPEGTMTMLRDDQRRIDRLVAEIGLEQD